MKGQRYNPPTLSREQSESKTPGEVAMTFDLKPLSPDAVPRALAKAERYRLLNEPGEAESICRDALQADPDNQDALVMLLLALTEQFEGEAATAVDDACHCAARIRND